MNDVLLKNQIEMNKEIGRIAEIVKKHDDETFPNMMKILDEQTKALVRIESKHNQDFLQYVKENEELSNRVKPLEEDYKERKEAKEDTRKKIISLGWDLFKLIIASIVGYGLALLGIGIPK